MPNDQELYNYYADPDHRTPAGPGVRRKSKPLTTHVPIRFSPETISGVKKLADHDRKTVSSWIRDVVEAEIERRRPRIPQSIGAAWVPVNMHFTVNSNVVVPPESSTVADSESPADDSLGVVV
jgi:hypothetical protein